MKYKITTIEKFEVEATYIVDEAKDEEDAINQIRKGEVGYISHEHTGNDEFVKVLEIEKLKD